MPAIRTPLEVGAAVRAARRGRGWSQQQAADAANVSRRFVNLVESGHANAELWRVLALLEALKITVTLTATAPSGTDSHAEPQLSDPDGISLDEHLLRIRRTSP